MKGSSNIYAQLTTDKPQEGDQTSINCVLYNYDEKDVVTIRWYKNNNEIITFDQYMSWKNEGKQLEFNNLNHLKHNGIYRCQVLFRSGVLKASNNISLVVYCKILICFM